MAQLYTDTRPKMSELPAVSAKARRRWGERSHDQTYNVETAWDQGVELPYTGLVMEYDEARYHKPSETILIERDGTIASVFDATTTNDKTKIGIKLATDGLQYGVGEQTTISRSNQTGASGRAGQFN